MPQVVYMQWKTTDRAELISIHEAPEEFVETIFKDLKKLKTHGFVAQNQHKVLRYIGSK